MYTKAMQKTQSLLEVARSQHAAIRELASVTAELRATVEHTCKLVGKSRRELDRRIARKEAV